MAVRCALFVGWVLACLIAAAAVICVAIETEHYNPASGTF